VGWQVKQGPTGFRIGYPDGRFTETGLIDKVERNRHGNVIVDRAHCVESRSGTGTQQGATARGPQDRLGIVIRAFRTRHRKPIENPATE